MEESLNVDEHFNRYTFILTNLPVAMFGSVIISLSTRGYTIRLFTIRCLFIGQFENVNHICFGNRCEVLLALT